LANKIKILLFLLFLSFSLSAEESYRVYDKPVEKTEAKKAYYKSIDKIKCKDYPISNKKCNKIKMAVKQQCFNNFYSGWTEHCPLDNIRDNKACSKIVLKKWSNCACEVGCDTAKVILCRPLCYLKLG
jgi:hypothetical protein